MNFDYNYIEERLRSEMVQGNMHHCLRDVGRIVGGYVASGRLTQEECDSLGDLAISLAMNKAEARRKWEADTAFGKLQPLQKETIVHRETSHAIGWDEKINVDDYKIVDENWLEREEITEPDKWNPCAQLREYLTLLFEPEEHVAYCTDPFERDGEFIPSKGTFHKTVEEIQKSLKKNTLTGFSEAVGTTNPKCGAWIVINPVDGKGRKDENITDFRYALVESDEKPVDEQVAIYKKLELPCACIVHSGGKSAHAIVRVNANSIEEYRKRVDFLYEVCTRNGLPVDKQNRNPSRYSRMPGVIRGESKQFIIERNCGKSSWDEWENWVEDLNDDLPEFEVIDDLDNIPPPDPEMIDGILRVGHKLCIAGPSKAGKSFLMIELALAVSEGLYWIGRKCRQGRVLYLNLEVAKKSFPWRLRKVKDALGIRGRLSRRLVVWNLRGQALPMDRLITKAERRIAKFGSSFDLIIVDPIYKVLTGDENSAADMTRFCSFLDKLAFDCNSTIVFCHHHSKGAQGDKRSMDRAAGSGVFARDPDAIIDLLPLDVKDAKTQYMQQFECEAIKKAADEQDYTNDWRQKVSADTMMVPNRLILALEQMFSKEQMAVVYAAREAVKKEFESVTGWRVSFTLREFATPSPQNLWFKYPIHNFDDGELLSDCTPEGETADKPWKKKEKKTKVDKFIEFKNVIEFNPEETWTISKVKDRFKASERTVRAWIARANWKTKYEVILPEGKDFVQDECPF